MATHQNIHQAFSHELNLGKSFLAQSHSQSHFDCAFYHLERAHILSQPFYIKHLTSHWWMLRWAIRKHDTKEFFGQILRLIGSAGSLIGKYPLGNTGGSNVSPFESMPIPDDLKSYFDELNS